MRTGAKGQSGFEIQDCAPRCLIRFLPGRADEKFFPDRDGLEVFFPVVNPILLRTGAGGDLMLNALRAVALPQEGDRLGRVFLRADIDMDQSFAAVLF